MVTIEIGKKLKRLRKEKGLTQKQLGELIGKKEITIRKYENGNISIPLDTLNKIANLLNVTTSELLSNTSKKTTNIPAGMRLELTHQFLERLNTDETRDMKASIISMLHQLICLRTNGEYLAIDLSQQDIEDITSQLLLVFEINLKQRNSATRHLLNPHK